jgi:hypothetical protein
MPAGQTGFQVRYSAGTSAGKGLGVFARERVAKGRVVWRHVPGVFTVYDEPAFRARIASMSPAEVIYELTHVHALEDFPGCLIRALDDGILVNHAWEPTLVTNNTGPAGITLDPRSPRYLREVAAALVDDRYSLVATRDIESGEELTNDYTAEDACPAFYDNLYARYGIRDDYLDQR